VNIQQTVDVIKGFLLVTLEISMPLLCSAMIIGLIVSIFQAATQINESTLSFLPKVAVIIGVIFVFSPWMVHKMKDYTRSIYEKIPEIGKNKIEE